MALLYAKITQVKVEVAEKTTEVIYSDKSISLLQTTV